VGKTSARLLIATSLIAGAGFGGSALNASAASLGLVHPPVLNKAANNVSCFDTSPHEASFVAVAPDIRLEILDWGGTGETMVLLTGLGDNAHAFDELAYQFTDRFHVIGITRRGYGRSSQAPQGYDLATRVRDDIAVLDTLRIRQAVFVGHSVAGTELSRLAAGARGANRCQPSIHAVRRYRRTPACRLHLDSCGAVQLPTNGIAADDRLHRAASRRCELQHL